MSARDANIEAQLARTWADKPGLVGWLSTTDHKRVGRRYLVTAIVFFALAGLMALVMRTQLALPDNHLLGPDLTHIASRPMLAAGALPNDRAHLAAWLIDPQAYKPGTKMPNPRLQPQEVSDLVDYLEGLR